MKPPFRLITDTISTDTTAALEQLLDLARRGELIGIAFAGMLKQRRYFVNTAGTAHESPTFTRGMLATLDDSLSNRIHHRGGAQ
jgi:hypothetical protein